MANIAPPDLRKSRATSKLFERSFRQVFVLFDELKSRLTQRLMSRSFIWHDVPALENFNITDKWRERWTDASICNCHLIKDPTARPPGFDLPRLAWFRLNHIRTGQGRCNSSMFKWNLTSSAKCGCGMDEQTMTHIVTSCPLRRFVGSLEELNEAETDRAKDYLMCLDIMI